MKRRDFITLLGGAVVAWPLAARAQQPKQMRRVAMRLGQNRAVDCGNRPDLRYFTMK